MERGLLGCVVSSRLGLLMSSGWVAGLQSSALDVVGSRVAVDSSSGVVESCNETSERVCR
jgi:hypothetical protein